MAEGVLEFEGGLAEVGGTPPEQRRSLQGSCQLPGPPNRLRFRQHGHFSQYLGAVQPGQLPHLTTFFLTISGDYKKSNKLSAFGKGFGSTTHISKI